MSDGLLMLNSIINGYSVSCVIDSGASTTTMSKQMAELLGMCNMIDTNYESYSMGVGGDAKIYGQIQNVQVTFDQNKHNIYCVDFSVIHMNDPLILFGLDFMILNSAVIDIANMTISLNGIKYILNKIQPLNTPIKIQPKLDKNLFVQITEKDKSNIVDILHVIVNNILNNPNVAKFKKVKKYSNKILSIIDNYDAFYKIMYDVGFKTDNTDENLIFNGDVKDLYNVKQQLITIS